MGQTADEVRQGIDQKREDAAEKIDQMQAMVEDAAQQVRNTVEETKQQVKNTVDETKQQVKNTFDLRRQIEERPLVALGVALASGFIVGGALGGDDDGNRRYAREVGGVRTVPNYGSPNRSPGIMDHLRGMAKSTGLEETLSTMAGSLMGSISDQVKTVASQSFPQLMQGDGKNGQATASKNAQFNSSYQKSEDLSPAGSSY